METEEQSLYDEMESLFDDDESYESDSVSTMKVAREDIKLMNVVRAMAVLTLLTIAFIAGEIVFVVATIAEQNNFEESYYTMSRKITNAFFLKLENQLVVASTISSQLSSLSDGMNWPFVSFDDFEALCAGPRQLAQSTGIHFSPILTQSTRMQWENYASSMYFGLSENHTSSAFDPYSEYDEAEESVSYIATHRTVAEGVYRFQEREALSLSVSEDFNQTVHFIPIWQQSPISGNSSTGLIGTMFDEASNPTRRQALDHMLWTRSGTLTGFMYEDANGTDYVFYHTPRVIYYLPIFSHSEINRNIAATLGIDIKWETFLEGSLDQTDGTGAITVVVESTCNSETYTFEVRGQNAIFVAPEASYDTKIDGYEVIKTTYDQFDEVFSSNATRRKVAPNQGQLCRYKLTFYPTEQFKDVYLSQKPLLYKGIVLLVFFIIVILFIVYDRLIERRQNRVVVEATRSDAIVRSLFPDAVRQRLYENAKKREKQREGKNGEEKVVNAENVMGNFIETPKVRLKKLLKDHTADDYQPNTPSPARVSKHNLGDPIADLFPHTTILFADISGFTAWSSEREPSQVFTLLESIYKCMDVAAKKLGVFKVETVGDCYVAATGIPDPQEDHAEIMVRFARTALVRIDRMTKTLESQLGPGTGELSMRFGIHSGPVTAGVLRGQKARFQLFGDTMNVASRMESTGLKNKIQLSAETARILEERGHEHWVSPREDLVEVKGKGSMQTYWLHLGSSSSGYSSTVVSELSTETDEIATHGTPNSSSLKTHGKLNSTWAGTTLEGVLGLEELDDAQRRLIDWNTDVLFVILRNIMKGRPSSHHSSLPENFESKIAPGGRGIREQVQSFIHLPEYDASQVDNIMERELEVPRVVKKELRTYVAAIASGYRRNAFHNFEHASHVILSSNKLLKRIMNPDDAKSKTSGLITSKELHELTYGIGSDPLTQFAVVFSALIHDVGHVGVSNVQLAQEDPKVAEKYGNVSIAEQRSVEIAWDLLMLPRFKNLRACIYQTLEECERFRYLVVNAVIATDIFDPDLKAQRNSRWNMAFYDSTCMDDAAHRRATVVIDHIIQASDVSHTMQHWHIFLKWNERLYIEMFQAFVAGRLSKDPTDSWYEGELAFFDNYVIPLARKLKECGVFGVSSDEYLSYAVENRNEWERKGKNIVQQMKERITSQIGIDDRAEEDEYDTHLTVADLSESSDTDNAVETVMNEVRQELKQSGKRTVTAPPGKLGIAIDDSGNGPVVTCIEDDSSMKCKLFPGEIIVAIDGVDTSEMSATAVHALMRARNGHNRTITVQG